jgi:integrase
VRVLDRVCAIARLEDVTPRTLRHPFASVAGDLGFSELTIAALLGHSARGVTQRYIYIDEALRLAADRIADEMTDLLDGRAAITRPQRRGARPAQETKEAAESALFCNGRFFVNPLA